MEKYVYIVTLHEQKDLEQFYIDMQDAGYQIKMKRPISRNTHYYLTEEEAANVKNDQRVWDVVREDTIGFKSHYFSNWNDYTILNDPFWKDDTVGAATVDSYDRQWGHLHCAGNATQRGKGTFGSINRGGTTEYKFETVDIFNDGTGVDVIIVDDPISYDAAEFEDSSFVQRMQQYQWFNDLNTTVASIDDDGQTLPTGTIVYHDTANVPGYHGMHVTGTVAGQYYGWAKNANIYNIAVTGTWSSGQSIGGLLIHDYRRAFHREKSRTGSALYSPRPRPTISNHSYGSIYYCVNHNDGNGRQLQLQDLTSVTYRGNTYTSGNPGPAGAWTEAALEAAYGIRFGLAAFPVYSAAVAADVQDAIADGIVTIGAAGNDNMLIAEINDQDWNNQINCNFEDPEGVPFNATIYYCRGAAPASPDSGQIIVGALDNHADQRRASFSQYGPGVDIYAPGVMILSSYNSSSPLTDFKYGGSNYYYVANGTSMASPQVCGIIACHATDKPRFDQNEAYRVIQKTHLLDDMTFDTGTGSFDDATSSQGSYNAQMMCKRTRPDNGLINDNAGKRKTREVNRGSQNKTLLYPRSKTFFSG